MNPSAFAIATAWSYGLALAGYLAFAARVAIGSPRAPRAKLLLAALLATALWALACISVVLLPMPGLLLLSNAFDAVRYGIWFAFLWHLLAAAKDSRRHWIWPWKTGTVAAFLVMGILLGEGTTLAHSLGVGPRVGFLIRLCLAVYGLMLIEQVVRRVEPQLRWGVKPLAIALGGVFGLELLFYADAMLFGQLDPDIWVARGLANVVVIPLIAIATARNTGWTVDLHLSREAVFHSTALLISGTCLLAVAGAGYFVRYVGGDWGHALQIELLFAATMLVALAASSGRFRSKLKVFVSKHFFSYRYDYREEWLRFTRTLSVDSPIQSLPERTIMALADLVESPAGALWLKEESRGFVPSARWNMPSSDAIERVDGMLALFLMRAGWIIDVVEAQHAPERYSGLVLPGWVSAFPAPWLIVPLASGTDLLGFVVLGAPRTKVEVNWEVRDLLKTASRQAASYLGQIRATEALLEARKFDAFNRMSAFVVHDLKNLVSQLSLMLKNAKRHGANEEFQTDMLATVDHVVGRMNSLMLQLRTGSAPAENAGPVNLSALVRRVCSAKADPRVRIAVEGESSILAVGHEERLEHVIAHLLQNALEATQPDGRIDVRVARENEFAVVLVADEGAGMTAEFVRERLFKPFQTTKLSGMGIGVYESAQYVSGLGGDIAFDSAPGAGTRVRVRLPEVNAGAVASGSSLNAQAA